MQSYLLDSVNLALRNMHFAISVRFTPVYHSHRMKTKANRHKENKEDDTIEPVLQKQCCPI